MLPTEVVWGVISLRQAGVRIHSRKIHSSWKKNYLTVALTPIVCLEYFR